MGKMASERTHRFRSPPIHDFLLRPHAPASAGQGECILVMIQICIMINAIMRTENVCQGCNDRHLRAPSRMHLPINHQPSIPGIPFPCPCFSFRNVRICESSSQISARSRGQCELCAVLLCHQTTTLHCSNWPTLAVVEFRSSPFTPHHRHPSNSVLQLNSISRPPFSLPSFSIQFGALPVVPSRVCNLEP